MVNEWGELVDSAKVAKVQGAASACLSDYFDEGIPGILKRGDSRQSLACCVRALEAGHVESFWKMAVWYRTGFDGVIMPNELLCQLWTRLALLKQSKQAHAMLEEAATEAAKLNPKTTAEQFKLEALEDAMRNQVPLYRLLKLLEFDDEQESDETLEIESEESEDEDGSDVAEDDPIDSDEDEEGSSMTAEDAKYIFRSNRRVRS